FLESTDREGAHACRDWTPGSVSGHAGEALLRAKAHSRRGFRPARRWKLSLPSAPLRLLASTPRAPPVRTHVRLRSGTPTSRRARTARSRAHLLGRGFVDSRAVQRREVWQPHALRFALLQPQQSSADGGVPSFAAYLIGMLSQATKSFRSA